MGGREGLKAHGAFVLAAALLVGGCSLLDRWAPKLPFETVEEATADGIELRRYEPYTAARRFVVADDALSALIEGQGSLVSYFTDDNSLFGNVDFADPTLVEAPLAKDPDTALDEVMETPGLYTVLLGVDGAPEPSTLPEPSAEGVDIAKRPGGLRAVVRLGEFETFPSWAELRAALGILHRWADARRRPVTGPPLLAVFARYDPTVDTTLYELWLPVGDET